MPLKLLFNRKAQLQATDLLLKRQPSVMSKRPRLCAFQMPSKTGSDDRTGVVTVCRTYCSRSEPELMEIHWIINELQQNGTSFWMHRYILKTPGTRAFNRATKAFRLEWFPSRVNSKLIWIKLVEDVRRSMHKYWFFCYSSQNKPPDTRSYLARYQWTLSTRLNCIDNPRNGWTFGSLSRYLDKT